MADPISDERLREIATSDPLALAICAQISEPSWADVRAIAAELLAARARIAKLEQEPPMAMIDFGVGVNWKGLHEDMQRLRAERDAARAEVAAVDAAISDRGVAERDCRLPVAERIDNILVELKECSWQFGTAAMENERLCAEVERLRAELLAARNKIRADEEHLPTIGRLTQDLYETEQELLAARAEVERLRGEVDQIKADQCSLLRIIGDSFLHLHIPHSAMAFDGRNLTPHAEESARASEIYRTERDAARAEVERLRADLREALSLLRDSGDVRICDRCCENADTVKEAGKWEKKCDALLAKHKETP